MGLYYRLCIGLSDIGTLFPIETSPYDIVKNLDQEIFRSVYNYTEEQYKESNELVEVLDKNGKKYKRPRGIGIIKLADGTSLDTMLGLSNQLIFDFDCRDDLNKAKNDAIEVVSRLKSKGIPESSIEAFFSGGKGYNLKVHINELLTSSELQSICMHFIDGLTTGDTVVYNDARIIRLPFSKHKSGLYCIPITVEELINLKSEDIRDLAAQKYQYEEKITRINLPKEILELKKKAVEKTKIVNKIVGTSFEDMKDKISKLDFTKKTPFIPASKWVLQQGFIPAGHGQEARMILASTYKAMGMDKDEAYYQLKSTSTKRKRLLGKQYEFDKNELWDNVLGTVYSDAWQGGTYSFDHPLLATIEQYIPSFLRAPKDKTSNITTKDEAFSQFTDYAKEVEQNTIKFGIPSLDKNLRIMTKNVYGLIGAPGCLDQNTFIPFNKITKKGLRQNCKGGTIKKLYELFHKKDFVGEPSKRRMKTIDSDYYITSMRDDGYFIKNKVVDVMYSGVKECFRITTLSGLVIDATAEHLFFKEDRFVKLGDLKIGDNVSVHLNTQKSGEGRKIRNRYSYVTVKYHPKSKKHPVTCNGIVYDYCRIRTNRALYEANLNNMTLGEYKIYLDTETEENINKNLILIPENIDIHHINEIHTDDRLENLIAVNSREHSRMHVRPEDLMFYATLDKITSIESVGMRETYDIECAEPYHNFVANKFVVHNSSKTTWLLQVLENTSISEIKSTYFCFDMSLDDTICKILIRHTGEADTVIMDNIKNNVEERIVEYKRILQHYYKNTNFVFRPGMTIEEMDSTITLDDRDSGKPTKLIAVDYLSLIKSTQGDQNMKTIECIQGLRFLAHSKNVAVVVLIQPNKAHALVDEPITSYSGIKGSSEIAEVLTAIMTIYREGYDPRSYDNDNTVSFLCVKNRKGKLFNLDFKWNGERGYISELSDQERSNLKEFRKLKEMRKAEEKANKGNGW